MLDGTGELPVGWAWARLGEISHITGGLTKNPERAKWPEKLPFLRVSNVQAGYLDLSDVREIGVQLSELPRVLLRPSDLLIVEGNGSLDQIGRSAVWNGQIEACVHQNHIIKARFSESGFSEWVNFWLSSADGRKIVEAVASSTSGLHTLSISKISEFLVPVAPPAERQRIMSSVQALFVDLDEAEAAMARARAGLGGYRASLLHAACTGQLTSAWRASRPPPAEDGPALLRRILSKRRAAWEHAELARLQAQGKPPVGNGWKTRYPEPALPDLNGMQALPDGWTWASVNQLLSEPARNGISVEGRAEPPGTPALRLDALSEAGLRYDRRRFIDLPAEKAAALSIIAGDFLVSRANGSLHLVGRGCLAGMPPEPTVFPDTMIRLRFMLSGVATWVSTIWEARLVRQHLEGRAKTTAGIQKLSQDDLQTTVIPLPPETEMDEAIMQLADARMNEDGWSDGGILRQSILHAAFTGRLIPQDPADEPASALLARLRAAPAAPRRSRAPSQLPPPRMGV